MLQVQTTRLEKNYSGVDQGVKVYLKGTVGDEAVWAALADDVFTCSPILRAAAERLVADDTIFDLDDGPMIASLADPIGAFVTILRTGLLRNVTVDLTELTPAAEQEAHAWAHRN